MMVALRTISNLEDVLIITNSGIIIRIYSEQISNLGRNTQGVRLINLKDGQKVSTISLVDHEDDQEEKE